jgi:YfiH family protein
MIFAESKLLSSLKGVVHAFGDRSVVNGASQMATALDLSGVSLLNQVHSVRVVVMDGGEAKTQEREGDALVTNLSRVGIGVATADCVPVLIASNDSSVAAAVHAGWRGTLEEIVVNTLSVIKDRFDINPQGLKAAIGPSIGCCCYEVGEDVASLYLDKYGGSGGYLWEKGPKYVLDLKTANRLLLEREGVSEIEVLDTCTKCSENYYSYRREGKGVGSQLSVIGLV